MLPQIALITVLLASQKVLGDSEGDKRSVSVLARMGQLPYHQGKRYVAALARNGDLTPFVRPAWNKKLHHSLEDLEDRLEEDQIAKRYLGALAKSGDLRTSREEKRDDFQALMRDLMSGDDMRRLRLEALREELMDEQRVAPENDDLYSNEEFVDADALEKRGGIASLAKNGYGFPKRNMDDDLEELMSEVYGIDDKRNVASLARGFNFPSTDKKNIGSFLRSGGLSHLTKKDLDDDWDEYGEEKRNLPSLLRDRTSPLGEGKRHVGSLMKSYSGPYEKKNVGALAKSRDFPMTYRLGKREWSDEDEEEMSKRYVAALLRQGRLPVGIDGQNHGESDESSLKEDGHSSSQDRKDETSQIAEGKEMPVRKKKSAEEHPRGKRETFIPLPAASSDYILPLIQNSAFAEFDDSEDKYVDDLTSPINKRYFAARGGKIPGARLPITGRRPRPGVSNRRRQHYPY